MRTSLVGKDWADTIGAWLMPAASIIAISLRMDFTCSLLEDVGYRAATNDTLNLALTF